jgi:branched-chain amino acid transport system substrate-binding protein
LARGKRREKRMKTLLVLMSFLFVLIVCGSIEAPPAMSETLVIAHLAPMSGTAAAWGIAADRALRMAVDEINARGGIKIGKETYKIQVVTMDHRYVPGEALGAAKKVVREGIKFAFGIGGGVVHAVQPVLEENEVIYSTGAGGGVEYTNAKCPYTFRNVLSSDIIFKLSFARLVKMLGPIQAGFLYNNDDQGRNDMKIAKKVITEGNLPIEEITEFVERDAIDFSPVVTRLMAKKVNLIFNELTPAQGATFFKQAWEFGYKGRIARVRAPFSSETLLKAAGKEALEGFLSAQNWPPGQYPSPRYERFHSKYLSLYKEEPVSTASDQYAAMEFLAAALEKAGTTDTERVVKVLYDLETETAHGATFMVGKSLGYGIKTNMSYDLPFCEMRDGRLKVVDVLRYKE